MPRTFIRQDAQVAQSLSYDDTRAPTEANYETNATDLEYDLNSIRSALQSALNRVSDSMPSGNWWDNILKPSTLETGTRRGVSALNDALHLVEKKRILRDVWKLLDIYPGLDLSILLVNDLKAMYEAHRVLTAGSVHGAADTTNVVTSADATDLASAITLANDIKTQYNAHRVLTAGGVHGAADTTNPVTSANATDLATLITLINEIRTDYEAHRVLTAGGVHGAADSTNVVTEAAVGSTTDFHIFTAAQLPTQTTAAIGAVTTLGTVAAYNASFGAGDLAEVVGSDAVSPKNLMPLVDADTHLDPILVGGRQVYGLFQTESNTDGSTMTGTTPNRAQVSFVVRTTGGDDLELVSLPVTQGFNFAARERVRLEDLNEQDFLKGVIVEFPAGTTVTRQVAYNNQGTTAVNLTTHAYLDLEGAGLEWQIRDDLEAILFRIIEGSAGGTSKVAIEDDVDQFDVDAVVSDFLNGIKVDTGAAGTTINVGVTANQIDSGGALKVASGGAGDLTLDADGEMIFEDGNKTGSTWSGALKLSETTAEWDDYETYFGEVSLMNAIVQASKKARRWKAYAKLTADVVADTNVTGAGGSPNLDAQLPDYSMVGTFVEDVDVYLNGELLRNGADASANHDVYPGTTPANGDLKFEFALKGTGSKPDQLCMVVYGS